MHDQIIKRLTMNGSTIDWVRLDVTVDSTKKIPRCDIEYIDSRFHRLDILYTGASIIGLIGIVYIINYIWS